jgi:hypothetical protein
VASFKNVPAWVCAPSVCSNCGSVATTAIPPVTDDEILSLRRTVALTVRVLAADCTGATRRTIAAEADGSFVA